MYMYMGPGLMRFSCMYISITLDVDDRVLLTLGAVLVSIS